MPLSVTAMASMTNFIPVASGTSLVFLALLGGFAARTGGAGVTLGAIRVTFWGALAMAVTAGVGSLFGTPVSAGHPEASARALPIIHLGQLRTASDDPSAGPGPKFNPNKLLSQDVIDNALRKSRPTDGTETKASARRLPRHGSSPLMAFNALPLKCSRLVDTSVLTER